MNHYARLVGRAGFLALLLCGLAIAQTTTRPITTRPATAQVSEQSKFLRFVPDDRGGGVLQASVVTYRNAAGVTVDLIGAVHIADQSFFAGLEKSFDQYNSVLYEMVKPKDAAPPRQQAVRSGASRSSLGWVGMLQHFLKDRLQLTFQLEEINYARPNFVHADLDVETFFQMQADRGESIFGLMLQQMLRELGRDTPRAGQLGLADIILALQSPDSARQLKVILGQQFNEIDNLLAGMDGPNGSVILTERNKAAMKVLRERIAAGDKKLGIFYGAAHLKGMEKILTGEMGFVQVGQPKWNIAWDMTAPPATQPTTSPALR